MLQPGHAHDISLSSKVFAASGIRNLNPENRGCLFHDEGYLDFYKKYTFLNCRFECGIKLAEEVVGCTPWYLPQGQKSNVCDPWTGREFSKLLIKVQANGTNCPSCLPDCDMVKTSLLTTSARFRYLRISLLVQNLVLFTEFVTHIISM